MYVYVVEATFSGALTGRPVGETLMHQRSQSLGPDPRLEPVYAVTGLKTVESY